MARIWSLLERHAERGWLPNGDCLVRHNKEAIIMMVILQLAKLPLPFAELPLPFAEMSRLLEGFAQDPESPLQKRTCRAKEEPPERLRRSSEKVRETPIKSPADSVSI